MTDPIVPADHLRRHAYQIRRSVNPAEGGWNVDADNPVYGESFQFFWMFLHPELLAQLGFPEIDEPSAFYNSYYWLQKFAGLYIGQHGPNAGLEQQVFKLLASQDFEVDWSAIERIDKRVASELGTEL